VETGSRERDEVSRSARRPGCLSGIGSRRGAAADSWHGGKFGDLAAGPAAVVEEIPVGGTGCDLPDDVVRSQFGCASMLPRINGDTATSMPRQNRGKHTPPCVHPAVLVLYADGSVFAVRTSAHRTPSTVCHCPSLIDSRSRHPVLTRALTLAFRSRTSVDGGRHSSDHDFATT
jgi:hypothetical protein